MTSSRFKHIPHLHFSHEINIPVENMPYQLLVLISTTEA